MDDDRIHQLQYIDAFMSVICGPWKSRSVKEKGSWRGPTATNPQNSPAEAERARVGDSWKVYGIPNSEATPN